MTRRLYVARDEKVTVVARGRLRMAGGQRVRRAWTALVETTAGTLTPEPRRTFTDAALVVLPPVLSGSVVALFAPVEAGIAVGGAVFFAWSYLSPLLRRRREARGPRGAGTPLRMLTAQAERAAFGRAVDTSDRICATWPALGSLVDVPAAEQMLADALWEIAGVLSRRQELNAVLADLSRPEFAAHPAMDDTTRELNAQLRATKEAMAEVEVDLSRRESSLRRAEEAGRNFIREQEMREAIRAAEESLRPPRADLPGTAVTADPGAELAEQTRTVLSAYRELTAGLNGTTPLI